MAGTFTLDTSLLDGSDVLGSTTLTLANAYPNYVIEVGFTNNALDEPVTWVDITQYVRSGQVTRGRQHELNRFEAGTATLTVSNRDGRFSPFNTSGAYYPNVVPFRPVRIRAKWNGQVYPVFRGFVESWPLKWEDGANSDVTLECVDATKMLNLKKAISLSSYSTTVTADSPAAYFRLGDTAANTASDSIHGRVASLVLANITGASATLSTDFRAGAAGAITADTDTAFSATNEGGNVNAYLSCPSDFGIGNSAFSCEFWVTVIQQPGSVGTLLVTQNQVPFASGASQTGWDVSVVSNVVRFRVYTTGLGVTATLTGATNVTDGKPHHIVVTSDSTHKNLTLSVDGNTDNTLAGATTVTLTPAYSEFGQFAGGAPGGTVSLDEIAFYSSALSAATIYNHYRAGAYPRLGDLTGVRIAAYLSAIGWPATLQSIDAGGSAVQAATNDAVTSSALANMQIAADTEGGALFVGRDGSIIFYDRFHTSKPPFTTPSVVLGDSGVLGTEEPYDLSTVDIEFDDLDLYNEVVVTPTSLGAQTASDSTSQTTYGKRTLALSGIHLTAADALGQAQFNLGIYKNPLQRVRAVSFTPYSDPDILYKAALGFELLTRVKLVRRPLDGASSTFSQESLIEGVAHDFAPGLWKTTWRLSPTAALGKFVLDQSLLDDGTGTVGKDLLGW